MNNLATLNYGVKFGKILFNPLYWYIWVVWVMKAPSDSGSFIIRWRWSYKLKIGSYVHDKLTFLRIWTMIATGQAADKAYFQLEYQQIKTTYVPSKRLDRNYHLLSKTPVRFSFLWPASTANEGATHITKAHKTVKLEQQGCLLQLWWLGLTH